MARIFELTAKKTELRYKSGENTFIQQVPYTRSDAVVVTDGDTPVTLDTKVTAYDAHLATAHAPANAQKNVQSDWNATEGDALILNKPTLGALAAKSIVTKDDLDTGVQASLNKADTAIQSLDGYATETFVTTETGKVTTALNEHKNAANPHNITKETISLGNVTNDAQVKRSEMGVANGVATLDASGLVPSTQLPSFVDDVVEGYLSGGKFYKEEAHTTEIAGEANKIYVDLADNLTYRWSGSQFVEISKSLAIGTTANTAAAGNHNHDSAYAAKAATEEHIADTDIHITADERTAWNAKAEISDITSAVNTAVEAIDKDIDALSQEMDTELAKKAPLASPALTGTPTAPTAAAGTSTTQVATTEFVTKAINAIPEDVPEVAVSETEPTNLAVGGLWIKPVE